MEASFYFHIYLRLEITVTLRIQSYNLIVKSDVWTRQIVQTSDFTVKALMSYNSLYHRNFQMKTDINVKIGPYTKLCT